MKQYIHGTSYESAMNILQNGFQDVEQKIWDCSGYGYMYFRDADSEEAQFMAISNGQIAAAYTNSKETYIAVIVLEMSDELSDEIFEEDLSCENMYDCYQVEINTLNKFIASGDIKAKIQFFDEAYIPYLRPFYLNHITNHMKISDKLLQDAIAVINRSDVYLEEIFDYGSLCDEVVISPKGGK